MICYSYLDYKIISIIYMTNTEDKLPELLHLDVIRNMYCSQEQVDGICDYLWTYKSDIVKEMLEYEKIEDVLFAHSGNYKDVCDNLVDYLREEVPKAINIPDTNIGMLDLLYEISRRIRKSINLEDIAPIGGSLSIRRSDRNFYPNLLDIQIDNPSSKQEVINKIIEEAFNNNHNLFYDYAEQTRLLMYMSDITSSLQLVIWNSISREDKKNPIFLASVMNDIDIRIDKICGFTIEMKKRGYIVAS